MGTYAWNILYSKILPLKIPLPAPPTGCPGRAQSGRTLEFGYGPCRILELILTLNTFDEFYGKFYNQLTGTAMGTNVAPSYTGKLCHSLGIAVAWATWCRGGICQSGERRMSGPFVHRGSWISNKGLDNTTQGNYSPVGSAIVAIAIVGRGGWAGLSSTVAI